MTLLAWEDKTEMMQRSSWAIASSEKLLKCVEELRASGLPRARSEA